MIIYFLKKILYYVSCKNIAYNKIFIYLLIYNLNFVNIIVKL